MKKYEQHELGAIIPHMDADDFERLRTSIKEEGYIPSVGVITLYEDKILDGWHRYRICQELGIEPPFETYKGDSPRQLSIRANLNRRHLNETQRAAVVYNLITTNGKGGQTGNKNAAKNESLPGSIRFTQQDAAELSGASLATIQRYGQVAKSEKASPALIEAMRLGTIEAKPAQALLNLPKTVQTKIAHERDEQKRKKLIKVAKKRVKPGTPLAQTKDDPRIKAKREAQRVAKKIIERGYAALKGEEDRDVLLSVKDQLQDLVKKVV